MDFSILWVVDIFSNPPETPLIASQTDAGPVTTSALSKSLDTFFEAIAQALKAEGKHIEATAFERATVHWLRHTCGSHLALSGAPLNVVQRLLGHSSLQTTRLLRREHVARRGTGRVGARDRQRDSHATRFQFAHAWLHRGYESGLVRHVHPAQT
ncbi:MAG: site-specific integrase [Sideroxydans sp.]|jgi:integrase